MATVYPLKNKDDECAKNFTHYQKQSRSTVEQAFV